MGDLTYNDINNKSVLIHKGFDTKFINFLNNENLDWDDNGIFNNDGKCIGFKRTKASNNYQLKKIPDVDSNLKLKHKAKELLETIYELKTLGTLDQIGREIKILSMYLGSPPKTKAEQAFYFLQYAKDMQQYPIILIIEACQYYRCQTENRFVPPPSELIKLIKPKLFMLNFLEARLLRLLKLPVHSSPKNNSVFETLEQLLNKMPADI